MEAYYEKSRGEAVTGAVFSRLSKEGKIHPDIVEMAKDESMKSFLVIGPTGKGKTPLLMLNYNRLVKRRKSTDGIKFTTESKIRDILDHDENFENWLKQLNSVDFLFIDEMFRNEVWKDLGDGTERDKSNRAARNMWTFIDYLYKRGDTIVVQGAGNKSPDETLPGLKNEAAAEYWRRINETFKDIRRIN
jgi:predicted ATPase